ncbi:hypothetical protein EUTSA_v10027080mg [Eutrema salsugineum]|uniref:Dof zinc finger protein n=1 Tax=Eutrema salsugineum TaxID=72664 RepID=V4MFK8_EUTSA|nr:dof zinc finger protein DOF4.4 [Eutrema salsugineum]ESQ55284.1 hypothetical protein EUTSA_v10027080mg [Eutrema salsugineum]
MDFSNVFVKEDNQVNEEKPPPPRVCPRCNSDNTKFCYYNNYSVSQPRYFCKNCRRYWTHGGALRNIPIGGSCRKSKRPKMDQPSVSQVVSVEIQQANHHQPLLHTQETNEFVGSFAQKTKEFVGSFGSSSSVVVENHFGSLPEIHGDMVTNVPPIQSFPPMEAFDFSDVSFRQDYYDGGSSDFVGNPLINQSFDGSFAVSSDHNSYRINQEDPNKWNPSFNNIMNMNHNAINIGSRGSSSTDHVNRIRNTSVFESSSYQMKKHGP